MEKEGARNLFAPSFQQPVRTNNEDKFKFRNGILIKEAP